MVRKLDRLLQFPKLPRSHHRLKNIAMKFKFSRSQNSPLDGCAIAIGAGYSPSCRCFAEFANSQMFQDSATVSKSSESAYAAPPAYSTAVPRTERDYRSDRTCAPLTTQLPLELRIRRFKICTATGIVSHETVRNVCALRLFSNRDHALLRSGTNARLQVRAGYAEDDRGIPLHCRFLVRECKFHDPT